MRNKAGVTVLAIGLFAGTLDIGENLIFNLTRGVSPATVFQYIACGLIGPLAFQGGFASICLGVVLHYLIALFWTTLFYLTSLKVTIARRHVVLSGLIYGLMIYLTMNLVVLPNSRVPHSHPISTASIINGVLALMLCIGLPVSIVTSRYLTRRSRETVVM
jgi:hypothetical protein